MGRLSRQQVTARRFCHPLEHVVMSGEVADPAGVIDVDPDLRSALGRVEFWVSGLFWARTGRDGIA